MKLSVCVCVWGRGGGVQLNFTKFVESSFEITVRYALGTFWENSINSNPHTKSFFIGIAKIHLVNIQFDIGHFFKIAMFKDPPSVYENNYKEPFIIIS